MIRIDAAWFAVEPLDMRAGVDTALARVVSVFGEARAHHAYLFVNKRANRMKGNRVVPAAWRPLDRPGDTAIGAPGLCLLG